MVVVVFNGDGRLAIIGITDPYRKWYEASKYSPFKLYNGTSWPSVEVIKQTYNFTYLPFTMYINSSEIYF